jgi:ABC-type glutathione transport system ATPase component
MTALLEVDAVSKSYRLPAGPLRRPRSIAAVDDVSFEVVRGNVLGIVGESGSGKSTLARLILSLEKPTSGEIRYAGAPLSALAPAALHPLRRRIQMVFQDPGGSLNPRKRVRRVLNESLRLAERDANPAALLDQVGLAPIFLDRYPHELSGGQRQRVAIARALAMQPDILVADEPTSALDVSLQAQILRLLIRLRDEFGLTLIFITHDLALVHHLCSDVVVMRAGRIVERGRPADVLHAPQHPYTRLLLDAIPRGRNAPEP